MQLKEKSTKECLQCGTQHIRPKFCSRVCSTRFIQKKHREKNNLRARKKLIDDPIGERKRRAEQAKKWRAKYPEKSRFNSRKKINTGELANPNDVIFYGYKEPLRKLENGFGYRGVLMYSKDKDKVQCHFCGRLFRQINNGHLQKVHGLTAQKYKEKVGLSPSTALCGEGTRKKYMERPFNLNHMEELKKAIENRRERKRKGLPDKQSGKKMSLEKRNERGTCPDQLLDIISKTVKSFGRVPTEEEFLKFHGGKFLGSIRGTYGTWTNALAKLKLQPNMIRHSDEHLIKAISDFYKLNKRTPRYSDFQRGLLINPFIYYKRFVNLNHARLLANVPLIIHYGKTKEEWMPKKNEREKMLASRNFKQNG